MTLLEHAVRFRRCAASSPGLGRSHGQLPSPLPGSFRHGKSTPCLYAWVAGLPPHLHGHGRVHSLPTWLSNFLKHKPGLPDARPPYPAAGAFFPRPSHHLSAFGLRAGKDPTLGAHQVQQLRDLPKVTLDVRGYPVLAVLQLQPVYLHPLGGAGGLVLPAISQHPVLSSLPVQALYRPALAGEEAGGLQPGQ